MGSTLQRHQRPSSKGTRLYTSGSGALHRQQHQGSKLHCHGHSRCRLALAFRRGFQDGMKTTVIHIHFSGHRMVLWVVVFAPFESSFCPANQTMGALYDKGPQRGFYNLLVPNHKSFMRAGLIHQIGKLVVERAPMQPWEAH